MFSALNVTNAKPYKYEAMLNRETSPDAAEMGEAGLRFAEQFEMGRVLAAFERELFDVVEEAAGREALRVDASPGE